MSSSSAQSTEPPERQSDPDQYVYLHGVSWETYQALDALRCDSAVPRLTYVRGELELMSPSRSHERLKKDIARLVEAYAEERDLDLNGYGSWTQKDEVRELGLEPDECYHLGPSDESTPPSLAIEVKWTGGGFEKLGLYAQFGVPEVWIWERGAIHVRVLRAGGYVAADRSALFPGLDLTLLTGFLGAESQTWAVKAFRRALRGGD